LKSTNFTLDFSFRVSLDGNTVAPRKQFRLACPLGQVFSFRLPFSIAFADVAGGIPEARHAHLWHDLLKRSQSAFAVAAPSEGQHMRKKFGYSLVLMLSTICLCSCLLLRPVGPCYGIGCPALTSNSTAQATKTQAAKQPDQKDPNKKNFFARHLPKWAQSSQGN
jgi:hypothetical protein